MEFSPFNENILTVTFDYSYLVYNKNTEFLNKHSAKKAPNALYKAIRLIITYIQNITAHRHHTEYTKVLFSSQAQKQHFTST